MLRKISTSENELSDIDFEKLKKALVYIKNNLIDSHGNTCLTVDLLMDINNTITG